MHSVTLEEGPTGSMPRRTSEHMSHINRSHLVAVVPRLHNLRRQFRLSNHEPERYRMT